MSISDQLNDLKTAVVNVFEVNAKNKKSLIYKDGCFIGGAEAHKNSREGFQKLCQTKEIFTQFNYLYSEDTIDLEPQLLNETEIESKIRHFLCLLVPYLKDDFAIEALKWLIYKYEIHINQAEDILMSCLPYYENPIFINLIGLISTENEEFAWLKSISTEGKLITALHISGLCIKYPHFLETICNWPMKIVKLTNNDEEELKEFYKTVVVLGNNILDEIKSKGKEENEKYLGPFTRLITDGLKSNNNNFNHNALLLLRCFSEKIQIDKDFWECSIKQILTSGIINNYDGLAYIFNICRQQNYSLNEDLKLLCKRNIDKLDNKLDSEFQRRYLSERMLDNAQMEVENLSRIMLFRIVLENFEQVFRLSSRYRSNNEMIDWMFNIMSSILAVLTVINSGKKVNLDSISKEIRLDLFSKCLHLFKRPSLNKLNLLVIQNIVKLNLGQDHFKLPEFISWVCNNILPKQDQDSLNILDSIINETLLLRIKQKKYESSDKTEIIIKFIRACSSLPNERVLPIFKSVVNSLSVPGEDSESVLWIQLLFMMVINPSTNKASPNCNECLISPLLKTFPIEEKIRTFHKTILFLTIFVHNPNRKRYLHNNIDEMESIVRNKLKDFNTVKKYLLTFDTKLNAISLLNTIAKYTVIHFKESSDNLFTVSETIKDFISNIFVSMKLISQSKLPTSQQDAFFKFFRQKIKEIGSSLSSNLYLSLIADLSIKEKDESVKSKCIELLGSKLSLMASSNTSFHSDPELDKIVCSIIPNICEIVIDKVDSSYWITCLSCVTNFIDLGFMSKELVEIHCTKIFDALLEMNFDNNFDCNKIILVNMFLKTYIGTGKYNELTAVFQWCLGLMKKCIDNKELSNGELVSSLSLMHSIMSLHNSELIGWEMFGDLLENIFSLTSLDLKKLSKQSYRYQKQIKIKLSSMNDSKSLINTCVEVMEKGWMNGKLSYISGSISLFGCHLNHLNKLNNKYVPESDTDVCVIWDLLYRSLSFNENNSLILESEWRSIQNISIKALNQLCVLFDFDSEIMTKLLAFTQKSDLTPEFFLERNSTFFRFINYFIDKNNHMEKAVELLNNSKYISYSSALLKHLSIENPSQIEQKIPSIFIIQFPSKNLTTNFPNKCGELIKLICESLLCHLLYSPISDEYVELISNICICMRSINQYLNEVDYHNITDKYIIPLIVRIASNSLNNEVLLTTLASGLCHRFTDTNINAYFPILKTLKSLKTSLRDVFEISIRKLVASFIEMCKLNPNEMVRAASSI